MTPQLTKWYEFLCHNFAIIRINVLSFFNGKILKHKITDQTFFSHSDTYSYQSLYAYEF